VIEGHSQVLIIGAGPAGCAAGITLARAGVDVCVVDRASFPRPKICGDALSNRAVALARSLGAGSRLDRDAHALVRRAAAVFPGDVRVVREYPEPGWIVPRLTLDDALREALESSGAKLQQRVQVRALELRGDRVDRVDRVVGVVDGESFVWRAPIVIAADGPSSVAWTALARTKPRGRALAMATTAYYEDVAFPSGPEVADHYFELDLPQGYGWVFPAVAGLANIGVYQREDAHRRSGHRLPTVLDAFVARHPERFAGAKRVGDMRSWPLPVGDVGPIASRGILLVGDAGGFVDPLSGEGIWQALFTGQQAGRIASEAVAAGGLDDALARRYERTCAKAIVRTNRSRARVQDAMAVFVERGLYRSRVLRGILQWGYAHGAWEQAKIV
jgi:geranylgeranyl reductase family protein